MSAPDANGWFGIETAPRDGTAVLCFVYGSKQGVVRFLNGYWTLYRFERDWLKWLRGPKQWLVLSEEPTHWQPLPRPPITNSLSSTHPAMTKPAGSQPSQPAGTPSKGAA